MPDHLSTRIVLGLVPGEPDAVIEAAVRFAVSMHAELVCAWVDLGRFVVEEFDDGVVRSNPIDPDLDDVETVEFPRTLADQLARLAEPAGVRWSPRVLAGDPARALGRLADATKATMIIVGTRPASVRATLHEFFSGSVAVHLAHRQHRPVVMIPTDPVPFGEPLPWEQT